MNISEHIESCGNGWEEYKQKSIMHCASEYERKASICEEQYLKPLKEMLEKFKAKIEK